MPDELRPSDDDPTDAGDHAPRPDVSAFFERVYDELRDVGRLLMGREAPGHTLQPTVLVHEVYLKLSKEADSRWADETHFKAVAATVMRRVLIDHARGRSALKRGGGRKVALEGLDPAGAESVLAPGDLLAIDDALRSLHAVSKRQARVVEMRYFGGMTFDQIAAELGVSANTAKNDWRFARAWLQRRLGDEGGA